MGHFRDNFTGRRAGDTWSRGRRCMTTRATACSTRCNGANVDAGSGNNNHKSLSNVLNNYNSTTITNVHQTTHY